MSQTESVEVQKTDRLKQYSLKSVPFLHNDEIFYQRLKNMIYSQTLLSRTQWDQKNNNRDI